MGRVRTKTVKKSAKVIIERYYPKLTLDFETNKRICDEIAIIASKRLRNKIAGYTTHLMKRIQRGPVRGISFKLQEEERERKDQYVPEVSALDFTQNSENGQLDVDVETKDLLKHLGVCAHRPPSPAALHEPGCCTVSTVGQNRLLTFVLFSSTSLTRPSPSTSSPLPRPRPPSAAHAASATGPLVATKSRLLRTKFWRFASHHLRYNSEWQMVFRDWFAFRRLHGKVVRAY
ncbi:hypothetical protein RB598_001488 [Gaeumannomyces tritici]